MHLLHGESGWKHLLARPRIYNAFGIKSMSKKRKIVGLLLVSLVSEYAENRQREETDVRPKHSLHCQTRKRDNAAIRKTTLHYGIWKSSHFGKKTSETTSISIVGRRWEKSGFCEIVASEDAAKPDRRDSSPSPLICSTHFLARSSESSGWLSSSNAQPNKLSPRTWVDSDNVHEAN